MFAILVSYFKIYSLLWYFLIIILIFSYLHLTVYLLFCVLFLNEDPPKEMSFRPFCACWGRVSFLCVSCAIGTSACPAPLSSLVSAQHEQFWCIFLPEAGGIWTAISPPVTCRHDEPWPSLSQAPSQSLLFHPLTPDNKLRAPGAPRWNTSTKLLQPRPYLAFGCLLPERQAEKALGFGDSHWVFSIYLRLGLRTPLSRNSVKFRTSEMSHEHTAISPVRRRPRSYTVTRRLSPGKGPEPNLKDQGRPLGRTHLSRVLETRKAPSRWGKVAIV